MDSSEFVSWELLVELVEIWFNRLDEWSRWKVRLNLALDLIRNQSQKFWQLFAIVVCCWVKWSEKTLLAQVCSTQFKIKLDFNSWYLTMWALFPLSPIYKRICIHSKRVNPKSNLQNACPSWMSVRVHNVKDLGPNKQPFLLLTADIICIRQEVGHCSPKNTFWPNAPQFLNQIIHENRIQHRTWQRTLQ